MESKKNERFIYDHDVPVGYYDKVYRIKKGIQSKWHNQKFNSFKTSFSLKFLCLKTNCH